MKRFRLFINAGLLGGIMAMSSCSDNVIVNNGMDGNEDFSSENKELSDYNVIATIKHPEVISRANIQADKYVWNSGDVITLWNRNIGKGYDFSISSAYNDAEPSESAEFIGKAYFENTNKIVAVYPRMESLIFNDWGTISIPAQYSQASSAAELSASTYMMANGSFSEGKVSGLEFSPITALVNFNMTNVSDRDFKLYELVLEADKEVFPTEIKIGENGNVADYTALSKSLSINLNEQSLPSGANLKAYINMLPTAYGDTRLISDNTNFTLNIKIWNGEAEQVLKIFNGVTMAQLKNVLGFDLSDTGDQFKAGYQYNMNINLEYRTIVPEEGFIIDDFGNIGIFNTRGLYEWAKVSKDHSEADVTLETRTEGIVFADGSASTDFNLKTKEIDLQGAGEWQPVTAIYGTFEGNGFTIKNITIKEKGFIENNNGTIQNLSFDNVILQDLSKSAGSVAMINVGNVNNCHVKNTNWTISGTKDVYTGILIAETGNKSTVQNCSVTSSSIKSDNAASFAGLIGKNAQGTVVNSFVKDITLTAKGNTDDSTLDVGGLVAFLDRAFIKACYAISAIDVDIPSNSGGMVGRVNGGTVLSSYTSGAVTNTYTNKDWQSTSGFIGRFASGKAVGCYTTSAVTSNGSNNGIFCGFKNGEIQECYYTTGSSSSSEVAQKVTIEELQKTGRIMNLAVKAYDAKIGYGFFKNEDSSTSSEQPLILKPFDGDIPGFGGSDFGDGGDI